MLCDALIRAIDARGLAPSATNGWFLVAETISTMYLYIAASICVFLTAEMQRVISSALHTGSTVSIGSPFFLL